MGSFTYQIPVPGSTLNSIADPQISTALQVLLAWGNGNIDTNNLSAAALQALATTSTVTSLPGGPYDGQEIRFVADASNGVIWHFRYRAASASTYKWEFIGGPPLYAVADTSGVLSSTGSYQDISSGAGPSLTLPTLPNGGDFDVEVLAWAEVNNSGQVGSTLMSYAVGATAALDTDAATFTSNSSGFVGANVASKRRKTAIAGGTTFTSKYKANGSLTAGACQWANRVMAITPVRVG